MFQDLQYGTVAWDTYLVTYLLSIHSIENEVPYSDELELALLDNTYMYSLY